MWGHADDPGSWPLMRRTAYVDRVVAGVTATPARSHLLRGASGIGKTTVAAQVSSVLHQQGRRVVPVVALAELRDVPLAALAPLLGSPRLAGDDVDARVQELVRLVGAAPGDYVLVIDDAPLLDDVSASVVYQLLRVFGVPAVLTARDEHPLTGPIARLVHEDLVTVVGIAPLTSEEVAQLVEAHLREPLRPDSALELHATTEGNPLFLRELLFAAQRAGRLRHGRFGLEVEPTRLPSHLLDVVRERFADLSDEAEHLARLLAISQPWPEDLAAATGPGALDELVGRGIVGADDLDGRRLVRLTHPFFTEVLVGDIPPALAPELAREAARLLRSTGAAADRLTAAHLLADDPEAPGDELEWAAAFAMTAGDAAQARRLARAALQRGAGFTARLVAAVSASALGEEGAEAEFAAALEAARDDADRALALLRRGQHVAYRLRDPRRAAAEASAGLERLSPAGVAALSPEIAKWRLMAGEATGEHPLPFDHDDPLAAVSAGIGSAMFATMAGDTERARAALAATRPRLADVAAHLPHAGALLDLSEFLVHVGDGDIAAAERFADERRVTGAADAAGIWSYTLGLVRLHGGRADEGARLAELAVRQLEWRDFTGLVSPAVALLATARAAQGDAEGAAELLARLDEESRRDVKVALQVAEAEAWRDAARGCTADAVARLREAAALGIAQGHAVLAVLTASTAFRLGVAGDVAGVLAEAAAASPSRFVHLLAEAAGAVRDRDHRRVVAAIPALRAAGLHAAAAALCRGVARDAADAVLRRRGELLAAEIDAACTPDVMTRGGDRTPLSDREREVAVAAAQRLRNREIAERLGLSVRTVENHLANVYRKLGVTGRDDLAAALDAAGL